MSFTLPALAFALQKTWQSVEISGPDARDFLHRLTTLDFRQFPQGRYSPGAFLQHTGKTIAYFKVVALKADRFLLLTPQDASAVAEAFEKMHFAENLKITALADAFQYYRVFGIDAAKGEALNFPTTATVFDENLWTQSPWAETKFRFDFGLVVESSQKKQIEAFLSEQGATFVNDYDFIRITSGEPVWPNELNANTLFTEADFEQAIHDNKGCYPGQEVVERIRSMGQSPRRLLLVRAKTGVVPIVGQPLLTEQGEQAGVLSSVAASDGGWVGLALVKKIYAKPGQAFKVNDTALESWLRNSA